MHFNAHSFPIMRSFVPQFLHAASTTFYTRPFRRAQHRKWGPWHSLSVSLLPLDLVVKPYLCCLALVGKLFGDKGSLSQQLAQQLLVTQGLHLTTKLRKKMQHRLLDWSDTLLLRTWAIIETINDQRSS